MAMGQYCKRVLGAGLALSVTSILASLSVLAGDDLPDRKRPAALRVERERQPVVSTADPAARDQILANLALLEEADPIRSVPPRMPLAKAGEWKHTQTIPTKYGDIVWNWNGPEAVEETLHRSTFDFTVSRRSVGSKKTLIEDSQGGGFLVADNPNGDVDSVSLAGGRVILNRSFEPKSGRILREEIPGILSITYAYANDTDPQWTTRTLQFVGKKGDPEIQRFQKNGVPRGAFGALFLDPTAPESLVTSYAEDRAPSPHGLPIARAGGTSGILLASMLDFTYAGLDPRTGHVLYRRIGLGSRTAQGLAHEVLVTDTEIWVFFDNAGLEKRKAIRIPLAKGSQVSRLAAAVLGSRYVPEGTSPSLMAASCYWVRACVDYDCEWFRDCDYYWIPDPWYPPPPPPPPPDSGGGGGGGGGTYRTYSWPLDGAQVIAVDNARVAAYNLLQRSCCLSSLGWPDANLITRTLSEASYRNDADDSTECGGLGYTAFYAWTGYQPGGTGLVYLCPQFFDVDLYSQAVILIHETLHILGMWHPEGGSEALTNLLMEACPPL